MIYDIALATVTDWGRHWGLSEQQSYDAARKLPPGVKVVLGRRIRINTEAYAAWLAAGGDLSVKKAEEESFPCYHCSAAIPAHKWQSRSANPCYPMAEAVGICDRCGRQTCRVLSSPNPASVEPLNSFGENLHER